MVPERFLPVVRELAPLAERFRAAGFRLFLVGGTVRDLMLGDVGEQHDIDLTTDARPDDIKRCLDGWADAIWTQGERFGTIGAQRRDRDGRLRPYELTTFRAEAYVDESRKPNVEFADEIEVDLSRRDFTVNAMALELGGGDTMPELVDPFDGAVHLLERRLCTPLAAEVSFTDDPLRMLRAARFIAGADLQPDDDLVAAVQRLSSRLEIVSAERIRDELDKLIVVDHPAPGLWFLIENGLAERFLPELPAMRLEHDPIHRHKDVLTHTIAVVAKSPPDLKVRLAALFHDVGKPRTRSIGDNGVSFHFHEVVGARMTRTRMKALRFSNEMVEDVTKLVYLHLRMHTYQLGWTDSAVRRFVRDAGPLLDELLALTRSDCTTRNRRKAETLERRIDELERRIEELAAQEELDAIRPDIDGRQVMAHLGIPGGPVVGQALEHLLELRMQRGPLSEQDAFDELDRWWAGYSKDAG